MASDNSDYTHGTMPVSAQKGTFGGFMSITKYASAFIVVALLFPTLFYGASLGWFPALFTSFVVSIILGIVLKLKGAWHASMVGLTIVTALLCLIFSSIL